MVTTSGSALTSDVQIGFTATFIATAVGTISTIDFNNVADTERDAVQFIGTGQLTISVNSTQVNSTFQDLNDGIPGFYGSWIYFDNGPVVSIGDTITVSGSATNGTIVPLYSVNTFSLLPSGSYDLTIGDVSDNVLAVEAVPEPSSAVLLGLGALGMMARRRKTIQARKADAHGIRHYDAARPSKSDKSVEIIR